MTNPDIVESDIESAITTVVDAEPLFADPEMDEPLLQFFTTDVARNIHPAEKIALRYGFATPQHMLTFIAENRAVRRMIKHKRAVWEADGNIQGRLRELAGHTLAEGFHKVADPIFNDRAAPAVRLDAAKLIARVAGVDGVGAGAQTGKDGGGGTGFTINFQFSGQTQSISGQHPPTISVAADTTVVETPLMPALADAEPVA